MMMDEEDFLDHVLTADQHQQLDDQLDADEWVGWGLSQGMDPSPLPAATPLPSPLDENDNTRDVSSALSELINDSLSAADELGQQPPPPPPEGVVPRRSTSSPMARAHWTGQNHPSPDLGARDSPSPAPPSRADDLLDDEELAQSTVNDVQNWIAQEVPERGQQEAIYRALSILSRDQLQDLREQGRGGGGGTPRRDHQVITRTKTTTTVKRGQRPVSHRTSESIASPLNRGEGSHRRLSAPSSEEEEEDDDDNTVRTHSDFTLTRHDRRRRRRRGQQQQQQQGRGALARFLVGL